MESLDQMGQDGSQLSGGSDPNAPFPVMLHSTPGGGPSPGQGPQPSTSSGRSKLLVLFFTGSFYVAPGFVFVLFLAFSKLISSLCFVVSIFPLA